MKYLKSTVLQEDPEDLLLLATLAGHRLDPEHGPPIPFRKIRRQLQQRIRSNLSFDGQSALLKWFGGKLANFTAFAKKRARGLDQNQWWESLIAKLEPNANITIENVFDAESLPSEFKYVTVSSAESNNNHNYYYDYYKSFSLSLPNSSGLCGQSKRTLSGADSFVQLHRRELLRQRLLRRSRGPISWLHSRAISSNLWSGATL